MRYCLTITFADHFGRVEIDTAAIAVYDQLVGVIEPDVFRDVRIDRIEQYGAILRVFT